MNKIKVLVIDDPQMLHHLIHSTFRAGSYEMQFARQQQEIDDIQSAQPDILILNLSHRDSRELMIDLEMTQRSKFDQADIFRCADLEVDFDKRSVHVRDERVHLTPTEYDLLTCFIQHQGKVLSHEALLEAVREDTRKYNTHLIRVHVSNLRQKIEANPSHPQLIQTIPGIGYRFETCDK